MKLNSLIRLKPRLALPHATAFTLREREISENSEQCSEHRSE
jgi:hypothetical protein